MLAAVLAKLAQLVAILKLVLRSISKRTTGLIFLNIYTPPQHVLACLIPFFKIIDKANSIFDLKIKEVLHIKWRKPNLNAQQNYLALTFSLYLASPLCSFLILFFAFLFHLLFSESLTLITSIFYCLILLHLITTNLVNTFYNNYVINICPRQLL